MPDFQPPYRIFHINNRHGRAYPSISRRFPTLLAKGRDGRRANARSGLLLDSRRTEMSSSHRFRYSARFPLMRSIRSRKGKRKKRRFARRMHESRGFVRACVSQLDRGSGREKTLTKLFKRLSFFFLSFFYPSFRTFPVNDPAGKDDGKEPGPLVFPPDSTAKRPFNLFFSTTTREGSTIIGPLVVALFRVKRYNFFSPFLSFPFFSFDEDEIVHPSRTKSKLVCSRSKG